MSKTRPASPTPFLLDLLITLLTPMFLAATSGDLGLARFAAAETIESYRAQTNADLIAIAQIIGFGLAALAGLSQSMDDTIPVALALRLRGNATACNRAVHQTRAALTTQARPEPAPRDLDPDPGPEFDEATVIAAVAATHKRAADNLARTTQNAPAPPPEPTEQQYQAAWANGAATVAAEIAAEIPTLPPHQRAEATIRAAALRQCADDLLTGNVPPRLRPGDLAGLFPPTTA
jgi:hypothetical protein